MAENNMMSTGSTEHKTQLSRDLGLFHVTMIGVGAMIGAGIFVLTGIAAGHAGPALIMAFALNGLITLLTALSYAELGSTFPEAGGGYMWVKKGMGGLSGFQAGWMSWFAHAVACSLYILGFGYYFWEALRFTRLDKLVTPLLEVIIPGAEDQYLLVQKILAVSVAVLFGYVNFRGASETGKWGSFITILKVIILAMFIVSGLIVIFKNPGWSSKYEPFMANGMGGVLGAMGLTYIAFEGYEIIVQSGEEIKKPEKNIPRAIFISLVIVVPIYILVGFVALGAVEIPEAFRTANPGITRVWDYLALAKEGAMVQAARQVMVLGYPLMILGGLFATMSALNATIYSSSRVSFAMGRDKNLPDIFGKVHSVKRTPHMAVFLSVILIVVMALILPIEDVAAAADIMFILLFLQVNLTLIALRKKKSKVHRPFRVPLVPFTPILAILLQLILGVYLFHLSPLAWGTTIVWLVVGVLLYYGYAKNREDKRSAEQIVYEEKLPFKSDFRVLVPLAHPDHIKDLISIAASLAKSKNGDILALGVVKIPPQLPVNEGRRYIDEYKTILDQAVQLGKDQDVVVHTLIRIGHDVGNSILETIKERGIDLMVTGWKGFSNTRGSVFGGVLDDIVMNAECDVMTIKMVQLDKMKTILFPTAGGPHADFALELLPAIAAAYGSSVTVIMVAPPGASEEEKSVYRERVNSAVDFLKDKIPRVEGKLVKARSISAGILKEVEKYGACLIGAAREGMMQQILFGSIPERIAKNSSQTLIMTKHHQGALATIAEKLFGKSAQRVGKR
ncbi:MAG: amino acid permease [Candidatus Aminicenantes bacterium]|nr:amino acid permease [Candidatus Aminicenantes bacterium]